jgi:hypothetical protein
LAVSLTVQRPSFRETASSLGTVAKRVRVELDDFAWNALQREPDEYGISVEELLAYAGLYYLADRDSGRITRRPFAPVPETGRNVPQAQRRLRRPRPYRLPAPFGTGWCCSA